MLRKLSHPTPEKQVCPVLGDFWDLLKSLTGFHGASGALQGIVGSSTRSHGRFGGLWTVSFGIKGLKEGYREFQEAQCDLRGSQVRFIASQGVSGAAWRSHGHFMGS